MLAINNLDDVVDVNTGKAYIESYKKYNIDGVATGQFCKPIFNENELEIANKKKDANRTAVATLLSTTSGNNL
jgi:hypothetical protein